MCIVIDTNCFSAVFDPSNLKHEDFRPVLEWIVYGKGKIIYGGTKYIEELKLVNRYLKLFNLLKSKTSRVVVIDKESVDNEQKKVQSLISDPDFDDPHLVAIIIISKCRIICSQDIRSVKYVTKSCLYPKGVIVPKYYTSKKNKKLLTDNYIDPKYKPLNTCSKQEKKLIQDYINN